MKECPRCKTTKPLDQYASDSSKRDGRMSHCRVCCNAARMQRYYAKHDHEKQRSRTYYQGLTDDGRKARIARGAAWRADHPDKMREYWQRQSSTRARQPWNRERERVKYMKRHGGMDEWARMLAAQDGCCYLCGGSLRETEQKFIHVDHDHACCPGGQYTESCRACRRGLAHAWCNQIIGLCGEDIEVLRAIVANFGPVQAATAERVAAKKASQPQLMPHIDMPAGVSWPQPDAGMLL